MTRIVHYYRDLLRPSGVTAAIEGWQKALIEFGVESIALHSGDGNGWRLPSKRITHFGSGRQFSIPMLSKFLENGDLLVIHEGWTTSNVAAGIQARRLGVPYIVVPHGVYEPQILRHLKWPYFFRRFFESSLLKNALFAHVFYDSEIEFVHAIAPRLETIVAPTGLEVSSFVWRGGGGYLAWFGRYSVEHKGLDRLLSSYALVPTNERLPLRLRGIDYQGGKDTVISLVQSLGLGDWVSVGGRLDESEKAEFLQNCDGFIFPSRWESQGIALMEAISMGVPTLVSTSIHAAGSLSDENAATATDFSNFLEASRDIMRFVKFEHDPQRGQDYVRNHLEWSGVIEDFISSVGNHIDV